MIPHPLSSRARDEIRSISSTCAEEIARLVCDSEANEYLVKRIPGAAEYFKAANNYFSDRTLFGSSYPTRPIDGLVRAYREWDWAPEKVPKVMGENAKRLMRLK